LIAASLPLAAQRIEVDATRITMDRTLTISVHIEQLDQPPRLDSENLVVSEPRFWPTGTWVENPATGRKEWRAAPQYLFTARSMRPGRATVGPLRNAGGAIVINERRVITVDNAPNIEPDHPARTIALLQQQKLEPIYLRAEATPSRVFVGQQVVVSWSVFTGEDFITVKLGDIALPSSARVEELPAEPYQTPIAAGSTIKRQVRRRVALIPRSTEPLHIGPVVLTVLLPPRRLSGTIPRFQEREEVLRQSLAVQIDVDNPPAGTDVIGRHFRLIGAARPQRTKDAFEATITLTAHGDLRESSAPHFATPINDLITLESHDLGTTITRTPEGIESSRDWLLHITPKQKRPIKLPPLVLLAYDVEVSATRVLEWSPGDVFVSVAEPPARPDPKPNNPRPSLYLGAILIVFVAIGALFALRRRLS
jgi:hypothetical protein